MQYRHTVRNLGHTLECCQHLKLTLISLCTRRPGVAVQPQAVRLASTNLNEMHAST